MRNISKRKCLLKLITNLKMNLNTLCVKNYHLTILKSPMMKIVIVLKFQLKR